MKRPAGYLLDTNVLSESRKKQPDKKVLAFLTRTDPSAFYLSVLTLGELRKGAAQKAVIDPVGAHRLNEWIDSVQSSFGLRILPVDAAVAALWGELSADRSRPVIDTLLAATAMQHNLIFATRNTQDVNGLAVEVFNPWK